MSIYRSCRVAVSALMRNECLIATVKPCHNDFPHHQKHQQTQFRPQSNSSLMTTWSDLKSYRTIVDQQRTTSKELKFQRVWNRPSYLRCLSSEGKSPPPDEDATDLIVSENENMEATTTPIIPGTSQGRGRRLAIVCTCSKCDVRFARRFSETAYYKGVVLVRCPGCKVHHLIADRLGWFEDDDDSKGKGENKSNGVKGWDVESLMSMTEKRDIDVTVGTTRVKVVADGTDMVEVTPEDLKK